MLHQRLQEILEIVKQTGLVSVDELVAQFEVTPQTIRKDLNTLCDQHLLTRTHGGARLAFGIENMSYEARRVLAADKKQSIGKAVADIVGDNSSLFINIGTTTEAVALALANHNDLMVVTNNINVASLMRPFPQMKVIVASGIVRTSDGGVIGETAVEFINQFKVDYAVIGASGIDSDGALLDFDFHEVKVAQAILANARHVILAADSSKYDRAAPVRIGHISQVQSFVTDKVPSLAFRKLLDTYDIRTIETG